MAMPTRTTGAQRENGCPGFESTRFGADISAGGYRREIALRRSRIDHFPVGKRRDLPEDYDVESSAKAKREYDAMGGQGVPITLVGESRMNGFSEAGFRRIYP
jgi:hypothetical protein